MSSAKRPVRLLPVRGQAPQSGSTIVSLSLCRWLHEQGVAVAPVHRGSPGGWRSVACPAAGRVSWPAALLAEACGLAPEPLFEAGMEAAEALGRRFDVVVSDGEAGGLEIVRSGGRLRFLLSGEAVSLRECDPWPYLDPEPEDLRSLPGGESAGAPRCGVVSLPHLLDFAGWSAVRGAEWLTTPGIGRYDFLFLPMTADRGFDRTWLDEQGLSPWLRQQAEAGVRVLSVGWSWDGAARIEPEVILSDVLLSRLTGYRWPKRLPSPAEWEALSAWLERGAGRERLLRLLP